MSELDEKLNSILSNPQMLQQIMSIAQSLNQANPETPNAKPTESGTVFSGTGVSPSLLNRVSNIMQHGSIDKNQQSLLNALAPYLSRQKLQKLEKAMHAAKMAGIASELVSSRSNLPSSGR